MKIGQEGSIWNFGRWSTARKLPVVSLSLAICPSLPEVQPRTRIAAHRRKRRACRRTRFSSSTPAATGRRHPCRGPHQNNLRKLSGSRSASFAAMSSGATYIVPTSPPRCDVLTPPTKRAQ